MATQTETVRVIEENLEAVNNTGRRAARTYVGLLTMAYDESKTLLERAQSLLTKAEQRGQTVEAETRQEVEKYYQQASEKVTELRSRMNRQADEAETAAEEQVEVQVERLDKLLARMGVPTRREIVKLDKRIDALIREIDKQMLKTEADVVVEQPLANYDQLTAREINKQLDALTINELVAVKQYEMAHENRVTVLREVDRRIEKMPIARYDELTVDEIEPLLNTLDVEQLTTVKAYEMAHENRVTLVRAIDQELETREVATE